MLLVAWSLLTCEPVIVSRAVDRRRHPAKLEEHRQEVTEEAEVDQGEDGLGHALEHAAADDVEEHRGGRKHHEGECDIAKAGKRLRASG